MRIGPGARWKDGAGGWEDTKQHCLQPSDTDNAGATAELPGEWRPHCRGHLVRTNPQVHALPTGEGTTGGRGHPGAGVSQGHAGCRRQGELAERSNKCNKDS